MFKGWRSKNINVPCHTSCVSCWGGHPCPCRTSCNSSFQTSRYSPDKTGHCFHSFLLGRAPFHLFRDSLLKRSCARVKGLKGYRCLVGPFIMLHKSRVSFIQIRFDLLAYLLPRESWERSNTYSSIKIRKVRRNFIHQQKMEQCRVQNLFNPLLLFFFPPTHCKISEKKLIK